MVLVLCLVRIGSLCWNKHSTRIQLFWEGIHLVNGYGFLLSLLIHFTKCLSKKKILTTFRLFKKYIFAVFLMKYIGYQLYNCTFRYFYGAIRSDHTDC